MNKASQQKANPFTIALATGLIWGTLFGLWDNLPCPSLVYMLVVYQLVFGLVLGAVGLLAWGILAARRRPAGRSSLLATYTGFAAGTSATVLWLTHFHFLGMNWDSVSPALRQILFGMAIVWGVLVGVLVRWALYAAIRRGQRATWGSYWLCWPHLRNTALLIFVLSFGYVSLRGAYRTYLQDWPIFYPKARGEIATPERPNIVLITIDTLRADHLGAYGYDPAISPNIDALARRGLLFEQALAQSSWTMPSVASFSTSLYPTELQLRCIQDEAICANQLDTKRTTIAEVMREAGYRTQGYLTNVWLQPRSGFLQGLEQATFFRIAGPCDLEYLIQHPLIRFIYGYSHHFQQLFEGGYLLLFDPRLVGDNRGAQVSQYAQRFLRQHQEERFFLWLYYMEPHATYDPTQPFQPLSPDLGPWREAYLRSRDYSQLLHAGPNLLLPGEDAALRSLYDGEIADVDHWIGEVLTELQALGLTDRTLIVLLADHGEEINDHGGYTHGHSFYQEIIRVPLLFSGPQVQRPGRVVETPVRLLDLLPTLAEVAGAPLPAEARGRSLVPFLRGEELTELPAYSEGLNGLALEMKAVVYQGYKLIYCPILEQIELYDLHNDPKEQVNLVEAEPEKVEELVNLLQAWMEQSEATAQELPRDVPAHSMQDAAFQDLLQQAGY